MLVLIRCNDIISDPRAMKYVKYLQERGVEYCLIGWDRDGVNPQMDNAVFWNRRAGYNVGGFHAVKDRIGWMRFVYHTIRSMKSAKTVLHGCDLDSAFPAAVYRTFHRPTKCIFDVFDWYSSTLYNQNKIILLFFRLMEKFTTKHSDYIIICESERIEQIPYDIPETKLRVLPNIPYFDSEDFLKKDPQKSFDNNLITFSYVGGFSNERCIDEIISIAEKGIINLAIAGFGNDAIQKRLESLKICPNIKYYGKVKYTDGLNISYNSDVVYAMYSIANPNHIYAAPNKLYEAMFLGKPIFTSNGTLVEKKVKEFDIGYTSGESIEEITAVIKSIDKVGMANKSCNSTRNWENKFKYFTRRFMESEYSAIIDLG